MYLSDIVWSNNQGGLTYAGPYTLSNPKVGGFRCGDHLTRFSWFYALGGRAISRFWQASTDPCISFFYRPLKTLYERNHIV